MIFTHLRSCAAPLGIVSTVLSQAGRFLLKYLPLLVQPELEYEPALNMNRLEYRPATVRKQMQGRSHPKCSSWGGCQSPDGRLASCRLVRRQNQIWSYGMSVGNFQRDYYLENNADVAVAVLKVLHDGGAF